MSKTKRTINEVTVLGEDEDDSLVACFRVDADGNITIGVDLDGIIENMNLDAILGQSIIEKYESMFASLIFDKGTKDLWQHAFFDVYLYALALEVREGERNE